VLVSFILTQAEPHINLELKRPEQTYYKDSTLGTGSPWNRVKLRRTKCRRRSVAAGAKEEESNRINEERGRRARDLARSTPCGCADGGVGLPAAARSSLLLGMWLQRNIEEEVAENDGRIILPYQQNRSTTNNESYSSS
jgi:hypothetical protein